MNPNRSSPLEGLPSGADDDSEVVRILDAYLSGIEAGQPADLDKLLADHPALAGQLRAYLQVMNLAGRLAEDSPARPAGPTSRGSAPARGSSPLTTLDFGPGPPPHVHLRTPGEEHEPVVKPRSDEMPHQDGAGSGRYQLQGEIGRGGMGAILKGRDVDLGRDLAIKVLLESHQGNPEVVRRFVEEAQIGGQLQHPGVVPVYELGTFPDRRPYFAMKLVKGRTLASLLHERTGPAQDLTRFVAIFEQICQTMAYAHARGVIHRDLKPSNVMVGSFGEVQVMDWGLAKVLPGGGIADEFPTPSDNDTVITTVRSGSDADASHAGSVLGTPSYMSPEQARGEVDLLDERADVFGLGAILCEILTGKPPFLGGDRHDIRDRAARGDLTDVLQRLERCGVESELAGLCRDCLADKRESRPRDASEVARRMNSYLSGVQERLRVAELARVEAQTRAAEERKRRRVTVALAGSVLVIAGLAVGGWTYMVRQRQARAEQFNRTLGEAEGAYAEARRIGDDQSRWLAARDAAHAVEGLLADAPDEQTRNHVNEFVRQVTQAAAAAQSDQLLLDKLVDIRSAEADDPDGSVSDADYAHAFHEAGIDVDTMPPDQAGASIKARPASVALALAGAIDDWALKRRKSRPRQEQAWTRLVAIVRAADSDPRRDRLRELWAQVDRKAQREPLRKLAREANPETWPAQSLLLLAGAVIDAGELNVAESLLRRAQLRHPGDVWINYSLGDILHHAHTPQYEEAIRFFSIARALRPETAHELAHALDRGGRGDEAATVFRELVQLRPNSGAHWACYGRLLKDRGDQAAAEEALNRAVLELRKTIQLEPRANDHNNLGLALEAQGKLVEAIAEYHESLRLDPDSAAPHANLGAALQKQGKLAEAIAECREAIRLWPDTPQAHYSLGQALHSLGRVAEAIAEFREAIRLKSHDFRAHFNLGNTLLEQGKPAEAVAEYREAIRLKPDFHEAHCNLGAGLSEQGRLADAVAEYREAIRLKPDFHKAHFNLGNAMWRLGKPAEAIAEFREAIRLEPNVPQAHYALGNCLISQGRATESITEYREALRLKPDSAEAHCNLGIAYSESGKMAEAIAEYQEAIRLKPDLAKAHYNLGNSLFDQGKVADAITEYREAIRLEHSNEEAHFSLGSALGVQGKPAESIAEYREAIRLKPDYPEAHHNLGLALRGQGEFVAAVVELRKARDLAKTNHELAQIIEGELKIAEAHATLAARLPALLRGEDHPRNAIERLEFGFLCYNLNRFSASARLCAEAFQADPKLAEDMKVQNRYNAACAAALAGCGQGKDEPPLDEPARARWRKQAIDWLKADLAFWSQILEKGQPEARQSVPQTLRHWKVDSDLAALRDPAALAKLPEDDQKACRALWTKVDALLENPRGGTAP